MEAPFETEFLIRRIGQLWTQAADLPERSAAQAQIEELACKLSDYVSGLYQKQPKGGSASPTQIGVCEREADPDPISVVAISGKFRDRLRIRKRSAAVYAGPGNVSEGHTDHTTVLVGGPAGRRRCRNGG
jgi:hypothetical protein